MTTPARATAQRLGSLTGRQLVLRRHEHTLAARHPGIPARRRPGLRIEQLPPAWEDAGAVRRPVPPILLAFALLLARSAAAAPPDQADEIPDLEDEAEPSADEDPATAALHRAGERFGEGQALFDEHDYAGAIEAWSEALSILPEDPAFEATREQLRYALAQAHVEAYRVDDDPDHLYRADRLLFDYLESLPPDSEARGPVEAERAKLAPLIEAVETERAEHEQALRQEERAGRAEAVEAAELEATRKRLAERESGARALIASGGVALGLGAGALTLMAYALREGTVQSDRGDALAADPQTSDAELERVLRDGERADGLALTSGIMAGALILPGAGLLVGGIILRRRARRDLDRLGLQVAPGWSRDGVSLQVGGRF